MDMFTGIIEARWGGRAHSQGGDEALYSQEELSFGDVQLATPSPPMGFVSVTDFIHELGRPIGYCADVSVETLSLTTVGQWRLGDEVNLE